MAHDPHVIKKQRDGGTRHGEVTYYAVGWQRTTMSAAREDLRRFLREDGLEPALFDHKAVVMEGHLHFEYEYSEDGLLKFPVGWAQTDTGLTALHALHSALESLSGKSVRVTIEWNDQPAPGAKE